MTTLQEIADREGVSRQAVWQRTPKGRAYQKAYQRAYQKRMYVPIAKLREAGLIK